MPGKRSCCIRPVTPLTTGEAPRVQVAAVWCCPTFPPAWVTARAQRPTRPRLTRPTSIYGSYTSMAMPQTLLSILRSDFSTRRMRPPASCYSCVAFVASATIGLKVTGSAKLLILVLLITRGHTAAATGACMSTTAPSRIMIALCSPPNLSILRQQFFRRSCLPSLFWFNTHDLLGNPPAGLTPLCRPTGQCSPDRPHRGRSRHPRSNRKVVDPRKVGWTFVPS